MSDTPRTDAAEHNMGSVVEPHYVVDADFSRYLERELAGANARLNFLSQLFSKKWNGVLGKGSTSYYELRGDCRHIVKLLEGKTLDAAIDAAMKEGGK